MNREKIVKELNEYVKSINHRFNVVGDRDLNLTCGIIRIVWFVDFNKFNLKMQAESLRDSDYLLIVKTGIVNKFYRKAIELLNEYEHKKYTVQVLPSEYGFLYKLKNDLFYLTTSDVGRDCTFSPYFTQSEIEELKKRDDVSIDWNKAIIKEVKENEND